MEDVYRVVEVESLPVCLLLRISFFELIENFQLDGHLVLVAVLRVTEVPAETRRQRSITNCQVELSSVS